MKERLSYEDLKGISTNIRNKSRDMEVILNNIKSEFNKVGNKGLWSGQSANATQQDFLKLAAKFPAFKQAVDSCSDHLDKVYANYKAAEQRINSSRIG